MAEGIVDGLGDAWFDLGDGDPHTVNTYWQADFIGDQQILEPAEG